MQIIGYGLTAQTLSVVLSAIFRSAGNTRIPLAANLTSNAANIVGNFFLIYPVRSLTIGSHTISIWGAGLGAAGAACSTMLSQMLLLVILLVFLTTAQTPIRLNPFHTDYHVERQVLGQLWHIKYSGSSGTFDSDLRTGSLNSHDLRSWDYFPGSALSDQSN